MWDINDDLQIWISSVVSSEQMYSKGIQSSFIKRFVFVAKTFKMFLGYFWAAHLESVFWAAHFSVLETGLCHLLWWLRLPVESRPPQRQQLSWSEIPDISWYLISIRYILEVKKDRRDQNVKRSDTSWDPTSAEAATIWYQLLDLWTASILISYVRSLGSSYPDVWYWTSLRYIQFIVNIRWVPTSAEEATIPISDLRYLISLQDISWSLISKLGCVR